MKFYKKSLIYKNTTLYDIDFPQKIGILRFFLRKFLLTVFHIISWKILLIFIVQSFKKSTFPYTPIYYIFMIRILCSFQKSQLLYDIDFPQKIEKLMSVFWFFGPFLLTVFFSLKIPKFQKWNFIKNPYIYKNFMQHCTTLIFLKKLEFCDFF